MAGPKRKRSMDSSSEYFFMAADRILDQKYLPSIEDILRVRNHTQSVQDTVFIYKKVYFRLTDTVAKPKILQNLFGQIKAVFFVVDLSSYCLQNNNNQCLEESVKLFKEGLQSKECNKYVLFLNKLDMFEEGLWHTPLNSRYPDYTGTTLDSALQYITQMYTKHMPPTKECTIYIITATNTTIMKETVTTIFNAIAKDFKGK